jgi:hypothetical protein
LTITEKLRQAYHNDLTDVPLLLDAADEIDRLTRERDEWREHHDRADHRAFAYAQEIERLREALTIANEDARKLAVRLEGESNLVAELSRRLARD